MLTRLGDYYREALDGQIVLTKFLDLEEIKEINSLNKDGLKVYLYGGYEEAERVRAIVQLAYYEAPLPADFKIAIYKTEYNANYQTIGHRNVLGSIMSLGIERNTFGDIYINNQVIYLFLTEEISRYMIQNMPMIMHQRLEFRKVDNICDDEKNQEVTKEIQVPSLRLDVIIAKCLNISRAKAAEIIEAGNVSINHLICKNISYQCQLKQIISIRKFGRITILENLRTTRKDRIVLLVGVYH